MPAIDQDCADRVKIRKSPLGDGDFYRTFRYFQAKVIVETRKSPLGDGNSGIVTDVNWL